MNRGTSCTSWPLKTCLPLRTSASSQPMPAGGDLSAVVAPGSVFTPGIIWQVNRVDQWGVEPGKSLANGIADDLDSAAAPPAYHEAPTPAMIGPARVSRRQAGGRYE